MRTKRLITTVAAALAFLAVLACGAEPTPIPPTATDAAPTPTVPSAPVSRSDVETTFSEPLSSGLSIADVTENALPSVAHIVGVMGAGTGFIVSEDGWIVTNKHVVTASVDVDIRLASGNTYTALVLERHPTLDLAYIKIDDADDEFFTPLAVGDSDGIRVGAEVIAIGFPLGSALGSEPTVSVGIISAKRNGQLQTDASLNPGNSGGPLLNTFGQAVGVVVSRVETDNAGRPIAGIGFAIPINDVKAWRGSWGSHVSPHGPVLPTPTAFPTIGPTPDIEATKSAIEAIDAFRRESDQATQAAVEAQATSRAVRRRPGGHPYSRAPHTNADGYPHRHANGYPHRHARANAYSHSDTHADSYSYSTPEDILHGVGGPGAGVDQAGLNNYYSRWGNVSPNVPDHPQLPAHQARLVCV